MYWSEYLDPREREREREREERKQTRDSELMVASIPRVYSALNFLLIEP
jgi:hypothetical protein